MRDRKRIGKNRNYVETQTTIYLNIAKCVKQNGARFITASTRHPLCLQLPIESLAFFKPPQELLALTILSLQGRHLQLHVPSSSCSCFKIFLAANILAVSTHHESDCVPTDRRRLHTALIIFIGGRSIILAFLWYMQ